MSVESISIILPAFNEAENIRTAIRMSVLACERLGLDFEVVVVDDGSQDQTGILSADVASENACVRLVTHERNRGYGAALKSGIMASTKDYVFFTDADLQFDMQELGRLLVLADAYDIIAGYRQKRSDPLVRRFNAWAWGCLVDALFELRVHDVDCAFKVFHRRVFERIPIHSVGAFVNTEILVRAKAEGFRIAEVPVSHYPRSAGKQTGADFRVVARAFRELTRLHGELRDVQTRSLELRRNPSK